MYPVVLGNELGRVIRVLPYEDNILTADSLKGLKNILRLYLHCELTKKPEAIIQNHHMTCLRSDPFLFYVSHNFCGTALQTVLCEISELILQAANQYMSFDMLHV